MQPKRVCISVSRRPITFKMLFFRDSVSVWPSCF
ncbi:protein of unknown function [Azospirillum baldaniorum]|uniref:Uncharacterized protein n=1 Tax=Azospirillum baldaniorum TaxID=1064539 RepID=A0A9P1JNN5_9PROT|nr:protein of unknown function [Azospirillum baldaniorum]